jgi:TP53 regulating kinase-like protein
MMSEEGGEPEMISQGAEAVVYSTYYLGKPAICKERLKKTYRVTSLDEKINKQRLLQESRCISRCLRLGVSVPV